MPHPDRAEDGQLSLHDVEPDSIDKDVVADRPGVRRPVPKRLAIDLAHAAMSSSVTAEKGSTSIESISMTTPAVWLRPPSLTCGLRQSLIDTVTSPPATRSRRSRLKDHPPHAGRFRAPVDVAPSAASARDIVRSRPPESLQADQGFVSIPAASSTLIATRAGLLR